MFKRDVAFGNICFRNHGFFADPRSGAFAFCRKGCERRFRMKIWPVVAAEMIGRVKLLLTCIFWMFTLLEATEFTSVDVSLRKEGAGDCANLPAVLASGDSRELIVVPAEMTTYRRLVSICSSFGNESFPSFLEAERFTLDNVLIHMESAGILKPAFTVLLDHGEQSILVVIRGTQRWEDAVPVSAGGAELFWHKVRDERGNSTLVFGYAHGGMVAAARWILDQTVDLLGDAQSRYPHYSLKVVGHSLGGCTAALLTCMLRDTDDFQSAVGVSFGSAACMTRRLAESCEAFVTTYINGKM